ncbi:hypothetical protein [Legionella sp. PC997]|uniref:hypothetical protein n=1 Tax=Legionella sp. PC997 TaxID=2755562 RepID=UPI0015F9F1F8|nr:hypothetical protein [Legionella sp. PC997]QMT58713.1 hypothetical protein HBNCFIEN_00066 [Legionella sp. PC997]
MISKEELILQHQNKRKQLEEHKEKIVQLQQQINEQRKAVDALNQKNKLLVEQDVPCALTIAKTFSNTSIPLNTEKKQAVLDYIQELLTTLKEETQSNQKRLEHSRKLMRLLEQVNEHLRQGYNKNFLAELTNKSGITSTQHPKNTGFALLLELLEEDPKKYTWTWDKTDRENLSKVVPQKIELFAFPLLVDEQTEKELASGLEKLEQIRINLVKNYVKRDEISEEIVLLEKNITQIETETIKELAVQVDALERQIKDLEQQEQERKEQEKQERETKWGEHQQEDEKERREQEKHKQVKEEGEKKWKTQRLETENAKKERRTLALELKKELIAYVEDRNQHYYPKDFFLPEDKKTRNQFIDKIVNVKNGLLKKYVDSGNSEELLLTITSQIDNFNGIKMQATLNRIVVKLIEADSEPVAREASSLTATQVLSSLKKRKGKLNDYALKIEHLYQGIEGMKAYAGTLAAEEQNIINQLADALKKDVDHFVCQNPNQLPKNEAYRKFKMTIKARLHSQDDLMSGHAEWPETILNILLSVITLGKLIFSKARTGRASLFFDKTEDQKEIEAPVDETLEDLGTFLAGG